MLRVYWRYFLYILEHKLNVFIECWKEVIYLQGIVHDISKFRPSEFFPYARRFYSKKKDFVGTQWKYAWLHHLHRNKHHWHYWVLKYHTKEALQMPNKYLLEMLCDWRSFSRKWGRLTKDTNHLTNKMLASNDLILHPYTRKEIEKIVLRKDC